VVLPVLLATC